MSVTTITPEDHSFDLIALKPYSSFASNERKILQNLASLLIGSGTLTQKYDNDELPILVAGLAKHSKLEPVKKASKELIQLLRVSEARSSHDLQSDMPAVFPPVAEAGGSV